MMTEIKNNSKNGWKKKLEKFARKQSLKYKSET